MERPHRGRHAALCAALFWTITLAPSPTAVQGRVPSDSTLRLEPPPNWEGDVSIQDWLDGRSLLALWVSAHTNPCPGELPWKEDLINIMGDTRFEGAISAAWVPTALICRPPRVLRWYRENLPGYRSWGVHHFGRVLASDPTPENLKAAIDWLTEDPPASQDLQSSFIRTFTGALDGESRVDFFVRVYESRGGINSSWSFTEQRWLRKLPDGPLRAYAVQRMIESAERRPPWSLLHLAEGLAAGSSAAGPHVPRLLEILEQQAAEQAISRQEFELRRERLMRPAGR